MNTNYSSVSNLYVPDFQAWSDFYENKLKRDSKIGFGFETEKQALQNREHQHQVAHSQTKNLSNQSINTEPKIVTVVSPTEQTLQQAESVMKKSKTEININRSSGKKKDRGTSSKPKPSKQRNTIKKTSRVDRSKKSFSYRKLSDIFSRKK